MNRQRWRKLYQPIRLVYGLATAMGGYSFLTLIGKYNFVDWAAWLLVSSLPIFWFERRLRASKRR
jgi:hypothetical protein